MAHSNPIVKTYLGIKQKWIFNRRAHQPHSLHLIFEWPCSACTFCACQIKAPWSAAASLEGMKSLRAHAPYVPVPHAPQARLQKTRRWRRQRQRKRERERRGKGEERKKKKKKRSALGLLLLFGLIPLSLHSSRKVGSKPSFLPSSSLNWTPSLLPPPELGKG